MIQNENDLILCLLQSYKGLLEMCQEDLLKELHSIHKQKELKIMGSHHMYVVSFSSLGFNGIFKVSFIWLDSVKH